VLERKLLDVMNEICDLLGSVRVDEWLSFSSSLVNDIQHLLIQRFVSSSVAGEKVDGQEVAFFRQAAANFQPMRYACSEFKFCSEIFLKWGIFSPIFCIFGQKFSDNKGIFRQAKIAVACLVPLSRCHYLSLSLLSGGLMWPK